MSVGFHVAIPFVDLLGFTLERFEDGESTLHFAPRPEHCNSFGVAHGGALMTFLDVIMATAARSVQPESGVVTIEMKTSFMRPAPASVHGEPLVGKGRLVHRTRTMAFAEGAIYDATGQLCATASGTFKYVPAAERPGEGKGPLPTD